MQVLVLGATGFIGGNIAKAALEEGWEVCGYRRNPRSVGHLQGLPIKWVQGDLNDTQNLISAMRGCDYVFHAAAFYPKDRNPKKISAQIQSAKAEIDTVLTAIKAAETKRLIYTSTLTTISNPPPGSKRLADERDHYQPGAFPKSGYYETKVVMENRVLEEASNGLDVVVLNPTAVFGPGDVHITLGGILMMAAKGYAIGWLPVSMNVVDVRDVAKAHVEAAKHGRPGERYVLGGHNYTVKELLEITAKVTGVNPPKFEIPLVLIDLLVFLGDLLPFLPLPANHLRTIKHWQGFNTQKAERELGLIARPFSDTVQDALDWFRANGKF
jgi:dihydroflavonol-4-reductase